MGYGAKPRKNDFIDKLQKLLRNFYLYYPARPPFVPSAQVCEQEFEFTKNCIKSSIFTLVCEAHTRVKG